MRKMIAIFCLKLLTNTQIDEYTSQLDKSATVPHISSKGVKVGTSSLK